MKRDREEASAANVDLVRDLQLSTATSALGWSEEVKETTTFMWTHHRLQLVDYLDKRCLQIRKKKPENGSCKQTEPETFIIVVQLDCF